MTEPSSPEGLPMVDHDQPSAARAYDYFLGGSSNFEVDRQFADQVKKIAPSSVPVTSLNRSFLRRAVEYLLGRGVRQFLDLGSGIPTVGNTHQIAERLGITDARTVYVDNEAVAFHHAQLMLADSPNTTILQADMRDVPAVLSHPETRRLLDFGQPVALLVVGVLLYFPDSDDPGGMIRAYRERLSGGSYVAISTLTDEHAPDDLRTELAALRAMYEQVGEAVYPRDHADILRWFDGLELVEPGLVELPSWHTDDPNELTNEAHTLGYGGVGRVPDAG